MPTEKSGLCMFTHTSQRNVPQEIFAVDQYPKFLLDSFRFISVSVTQCLNDDSYLYIGMVECRKGPGGQKHYTRCLLWKQNDNSTLKMGMPYFSVFAGNTNHTWTEERGWFGGTNCFKLQLPVDNCELYRIRSTTGYSFRHNGQYFGILDLRSWPCVDDPHRLILSFENDLNPHPASGPHPSSLEWVF